MQHLPDNGVLCHIRKRYFVDFIKNFFKINGENEIILTRNHELGRCITGKVDNLKYPKHRDFKAGDVIFCIPKSDLGESFRFLYINRENEERINDEIESYFNRYFAEFCDTLRSIGCMQKNIVDIFIQGHAINLDNITADALIKRDFRFRQIVRQNALRMVNSFKMTYGSKMKII